MFGCKKELNQLKQEVIDLRRQLKMMEEANKARHKDFVKYIFQQVENIIGVVK